MAVSEGLLRSAFSILVLWVYLAFGNQIVQMFFGRQPTSLEYGFVAVAIFLASYVVSSLVIRGVRGSADEGE